MCFLSTNPIQDLGDLLRSMYRHPGAWMILCLIVGAIFLGLSAWHGHQLAQLAPTMPSPSRLSHRDGLVVLTPQYWQRRENSPLTRVALRYRDAQHRDRRMDVLLPVALRQEPGLALNRRVTLLLDEQGNKPVLWGLQDEHGRALVSADDSQAHVPHLSAHHQGPLRVSMALATLSFGMAALFRWRLGRQKRQAGNTPETG